MENILNILCNPWVIGIVGGIISGTIVYFFTSWIVKRKDNTHHKRQIALANESVIAMLKPYIPDNGLPEPRVIRALVSSSARRYGVAESEMYSIATICEELISDTVASVYVSNEKKRECVEHLENRLEEATGFALGQEEPDVVTASFDAKKNRSSFDMLAASMAIVTSIGAFATLMSSELDAYEVAFGFWDDSLFFMVVLLSILLGIFAVLMATLDMQFRRRKSEKMKQRRFAGASSQEAVGVTDLRGFDALYSSRCDENRRRR